MEEEGGRGCKVIDIGRGGKKESEERRAGKKWRVEGDEYTGRETGEEMGGSR